jgi:OmpA-OmpF porin, OOP family
VTQSPTKTVFLHRQALAVAALTISFAPACLALSFDKDRPGAKDLPLVSRYAGSALYNAGQESVGRARIVEGDRRKVQLRSLEGKIGTRLYYAPKSKSPLEVFRNYQQALQTGGFQVIYSCEVAQCEAQNVQQLVEPMPRAATWMTGFDAITANLFNNANRPNFYYLSAHRPGPAGDVFVQVAVATSLDGYVQQFIQVIEPATIELGKVKVDAKAIGDGLHRDGKIALYGIYFDTNKAVLREDSVPQLEEMAKVLKADPNLKVFIVGHTDNQGVFENNLALSQKRAQAVAEALTAKYGIPASRLSAHGVANMAPVASNEAEDGRARNRRVELVVR